MKKKVTLKDIVKIIDVDTSTVSKALLKSPDISVRMQSGIKKVADRLGYRPNLLAKSLISNKSNIIYRCSYPGFTNFIIFLGYLWKL